MGLEELSAPNRGIWQPLSYMEPKSMNVGRLNYLPTIQHINDRFDKKAEAKTAFDFLKKSVKTIDKDNPTVRDYIDKNYNIDPTDVSNPFGEATIKAKAAQFAAELNDPNSLIGNAQYNYLSRQKYHEDINKKIGAKEGEIDPEHALMLKQEADNNYQGLGEKNRHGTYNKYSGEEAAGSIDDLKLVNDALSGWKSSSGEKAEAFVTSDGRHIIKKKDSNEEVTPEELQSIRPLLENHPQFAAYHKQIARLKTNSIDPYQYRDYKLGSIDSQINNVNANKKLSPEQKGNILNSLNIQKQIYSTDNPQLLKRIAQDEHYQNTVNGLLGFAIEKGSFHKHGEDRDLHETALMKDLSSAKAASESNNTVNTIPTEAIDVGIESPIKDIQVKGNDVIEKPKPKITDFYNQQDDAFALAKIGDPTGEITKRAVEGKKKYDAALKDWAISKDKDLNKSRIDELANKLGIDPNLTYEAKHNLISNEYAKNKERHLDAALSTPKANEQMEKLMFEQTPSESLRFKVGNQQFNNFTEFVDYLKNQEDAEAIIPKDILEKGDASIKQWVRSNSKVSGTILGGHSGFDGAAVRGNINGKGFYVSGNNEVNAALRPLGELQRQILDPANSGKPVELKDSQGRSDYWSVKYNQTKEGLDYDLVRTDDKGKIKFNKDGEEERYSKDKLPALLKAQLKNYQATSLVNAIESGVSKPDQSLVE